MHFKKLNLAVRKLIRRFERVVFLIKHILSERHFMYFSCVVVGISCALAVIVLKSFAHNVFVFANYLNGFLKLPFFYFILPII